jgi:preprotein translocase subunit SecG
MSHYYGSILFVLISLFLTVYSKRDLFTQKCKRECNSEHGTMDCWKQTTDGFTYGLSTAMIDYCQVILQLQQMDRNSWYNISLDVLMQQVKRYSVEKDVRQLAKNDIEQVSILILDKCFNPSSSSVPLVSQPPCPSCSLKEVQLIKQWRLITIILTAICILFFLLILLLYTFHIRSTRRSYESIS